MNKSESEKNKTIELLEIRLRHLSNQHEVVQKQYDKTTEEYFKILEEISKANKQLQREISERKKVEKELKKAHDELELRIRERTAELEKVNEELQNDITNRKKAEKALMESEEKFRELAELLPETVWETDLKGNLTFVSQKGFLLFGYSREDFNNGFNILQFLIPEDRERAKKNINDILKGNISGNNEYTMLKKDGSTIPVLIHSCMIAREGKPAGLRGIIIDISERKKLEEQIQVRQRMDSLGTLAGGIAHDFNNILAGIMGYLDLLKMNSANLYDVQNEYVNEAYKSCQRAAGLIKEFQVLSIEPLLEISSVDICEIANEVFMILERTTDKLIVKKNELEPGRFFVTGKADQLHQVLLNLGTNSVNAIKAKGPSKGEYIRIAAEKQVIKINDPTGLPEGEYIHIIFEDTGIGMSQEVKRRAFDPFFSTRRRGIQKGQGLGLTMVYNIIMRNHKGYIDIDTEKGKGTTVHIYLPEADPIEYSKPEKSPQIIGGHETILIIEDEKFIRNLTAEALKQYGYTILTASDGKEGLKVYKDKQDNIDLVILDLTMPKMSGKMVLENILKINPAVKVVIYSGHSEDEMKKYKQAKGFIAKPFDLKDMAYLIRSILNE